MNKHENIENPNSCLNKAGDDEPLFIIRAKDPLAVATVTYWAMLAIERGVHETEKVDGAMQLAEEMLQFQSRQIRSGDLTAYDRKIPPVVRMIPMERPSFLPAEQCQHIRTEITDDDGSGTKGVWRCLDCNLAGPPGVVGPVGPKGEDGPLGPCGGPVGPCGPDCKRFTNLQP